MAVNSTNYKFNTPVTGTEEDNWGELLNENWDKMDSLLYGASYTDSDGNTVEQIQPDLALGSWAIAGTAVTSTAAELNILDGVTATTAELNILDGVTATATEINKVDGLTASTTELNYVDGVTSSIQTQLDAKAPTASPTFTGSVSLGDNVKANFGAGNDLQVYHNGGYNYIYDNSSTSGTFIASDNFTVGPQDASKAIISTNATTATLTYNGTTKLQTNSTGIAIAGMNFTSGGATVDIVRDEDDMSSNDANALATQQSIKAYIDANASPATPSGVVMPYAGATAPTGYLLCYGQAVSRTTYADLFTAISTTYGVGDGSTTFNLPDLRGRVVAGQDDMGGTSANRLTDQSGGLNGDTLGDTGGSETHTLTTSEIPSHRHGINLFDRDPDSSGANSVQIGNEATGSELQSDYVGGGGAHNNVQPTIILNYIIKT